MSEANDPIEHAASLVRDGGVIAHATEGVWGLACDPFNTAAIERLLAIKARDVAQGLIVAGSDAGQFAAELDLLDDERRGEVISGGPGPTTWLGSNHRFSRHVTGDHATVAIRVPGHDQAREILAASGGLMISTSANLSGAPSALTFEEANTAVGNLVDFVGPGRTAGRGAASKIIDATSGNALR